MLTNMGKVSFAVETNEKARLDRLIMEHFQSELALCNYSRSQVGSWITSGLVALDGNIVTICGKMLVGRHDVTVSIPPHKSQDLAPYLIPLDVVYEDQHLCVINKPPGLTVHPGAGNRDRTLVNALLARWGSLEPGADPVRPGIVHRLDKDTSGLLVVARSIKIHEALSKQFKDRKVQRSYLALVLTTPRSKREVAINERGRIETFIRRNPRNPLKMMVSQDSGKLAITNWEVCERFYYGSQLKIKLESGRTHQIRVHMDWVGSPVIADPVYGNFAALPKALQRASNNFGRQALHATSLGFEHPASGKQLDLKCEPPEDFKSLADEFRNFRG